MVSRGHTKSTKTVFQSPNRRFVGTVLWKIRKSAIVAGKMNVRKIVVCHRLVGPTVMKFRAR